MTTRASVYAPFRWVCTAFRGRLAYRVAATITRRVTVRHSSAGFDLVGPLELYRARLFSALSAGSPLSRSKRLYLALPPPASRFTAASNAIIAKRTGSMAEVHARSIKARADCANTRREDERCVFARVIAHTSRYMYSAARRSFIARARARLLL